MRDSSLSTALQLLLFRLVVAFRPRKNKTYTQFHRFLNQYDVLADKVLPYLHEGQNPGSEPPLEIIIFGCSSGAEPYSLASVLQHRFPRLKFRIRAFDFVPEVIAKAQSREYTRDEVYNCPFITEEFVQRTFTLTAGGLYRVKDEIAAPITFAVGNILDAALFTSLGKVDLVLAQNMLFHLKPKLARVGFANLVTLLKGRSALFVDGMDTGMRIELTKKFNLEPVAYKIEEVHQDAFINRSDSWASAYWAREPYSPKGKEWVRKFCTVYLRNET